MKKSFSIKNEENSIRAQAHLKKMPKEDFQKFAEVISIPVEISLLPEKMDCHYRDHIMKVLREKYQNKCLVNYGYILSIENINKIVSDDIGTIIPSAHILVEISCMVFLPKIDMTFHVDIDIIFTHGIFIHRDKIRILIPMVNMEDCWTIHKDFTTNRLVHRSDGRVLKTGNRIHVRLVDVRFEKDGYSCIGELITPSQVTPGSGSDPES